MTAEVLGHPGHHIFKGLTRVFSQYPLIVLVRDKTYLSLQLQIVYCFGEADYKCEHSLDLKMNPITSSYIFKEPVLYKRWSG